MATPKKTKLGFTVPRKLGKNNKGCPNINLIKDFGFDPKEDVFITYTYDGKRIIIEKEEPK